MPDLMPLLQHSLLYGAILTFLLLALFGFGAYLNPEVMLRGYPPDIKARYGAIRPATKRQRIWLSIAALIVLLGVTLLAMVRMPQVTGSEPTFWTATFSVLIMLLLFNLVDLLVLDWLLFNTIQPKFIVLPGTAGMAGYRDYGSHFKKFLHGMLLLMIISPIIAGIALVVYRLSFG